jgi:hypothetical protein
MLDEVGNSPGTLLLTVLTTLNPPDVERGGRTRIG